MSWFARLMYRTLVWKERQRARFEPRSPGADAPQTPAHSQTGARGEMLAYWYLRQAGYVMVARNWRARSGSGELDLVGWDGPVLAFIEVKTRASDVAGPPEAAVTPEKQRRIVKAAKEYMRRLRAKPLNYRFDIASVVWDANEGYQVRLVKDAFKA